MGEPLLIIFLLKSPLEITFKALFKSSGLKGVKGKLDSSKSETDQKNMMERVDGYLKDPMSLIKDGYDVGAHSLNHPHIKDLNFADQHYEVSMSVEEIRGLFGDSRKLFAFPFPF